jgi:hypothetical protein
MNRKTRYFVDDQGNYLGSYDGSDKGNPFNDAVEVPKAPNHARDKWDFDTEKYIPAPPQIDPPSFAEMVEALIAEKEGDPARIEEVLSRRQQIKGS